MTNYDEARAQQTQAFSAFFQSMLSQGVHLPPSAFETWFVSASHDDAAVDRVLAALPAAAQGRLRLVCDNLLMTNAVGDSNRTVVHLLRHGEVHNPTGVLYGRLADFHLSDLGREMAEMVGAHLADHDVTVVVASSLDRAQETAAPIASAHGLAITTDDRVIEAEQLLRGQDVRRR